MRHARTVMWVTAALASLAGCVGGRKAVQTVELPAAEGRRGDTAVILLPGFGDDPDEFVTHGFVTALRDAGVAADVILADAHAGYYFGGTAQERIYADVVSPAIQAGYARIWLVGVSMGGFGALWTAKKDPEHIAGIVLLAPFAGRKRVLRPIAKVGLDHWQPRKDPGTWDYELWRWLRTAGEPGSTVPPIWLAYGESDTGYATRLLQQATPRERVFTAPGGHDWDVWAPLWRTMIPAIPWNGR